MHASAAAGLRRALVGNAVVAVTAGVFAGDARSALFLTFSTTRAAPRAVVSVRTGGQGALARIDTSAAPLHVFLAPASDVGGISAPDDDRLVEIGRLRIDRRGNGRLRFVVPDVAPGRYATLTRCAPCAASSAGRELPPTGPSGGFVVTGSDGDSPLRFVVLGAAAALLALGGAAAWTRRHERRLQQP